jgi:sterol desaturase/sphingolipid hydroxylase (fatty acid hydroxylase superfamily)
MDQLETTFANAAAILAGMAALSLLEAAIPLHARGRLGRAHLAPNLALTVLGFATNALLDAGLVAALVWLEPRGFGLLPRLALPPLATGVLVVLALDFAFYVAHVAMHRIPALWRFHRIHHSDPAVDVTTTVRQHPGESVIRHAFLAAFAIPLGASAASFALYRAASVLSALLEHANLRLPPRLDTLLSLVFTWSNLHKLHHSRDVRFTDTNYGNVVSWWDRLFATFTPARLGANVRYGLDGLDDPATQSTAGLLALPLRATRAASPARSRAGCPARRSAAPDPHRA